MKENGTIFSSFVLAGFSMQKEGKICMFIHISIAYVITLMVNSFIIVLILSEENLHKPMYFFIGGLSLIEIWYPSVTAPKLLWTLLTDDQYISAAGCLCQFYFHFSLGTTEMFLLTVMAYDRYVAIRVPLQYLVIMNHAICLRLLLCCWVLGFLVLIVPCVQISRLMFCDYKVIDHYYCDFASLIKLSCSDTSHAEMFFFVSCCVIILGCFLLIILSYIFILHTMLSLPTSSGRSKAFSTCASHLSVVALFYGTIVFMFVRPTTGDLLSVNKFVSIIPSFVTPVLNPLIYTLRNQEVKHSAKKLLDKLKCQQGS